MELIRLIIENSEIKDPNSQAVNIKPVGLPIVINTPAEGNLDFGNLFYDIPNYAEKIGKEIGIKPNGYALGRSYDVYVTPVDQFDRGLRQRVFPIQFYKIE